MEGQDNADREALNNKLLESASTCVSRIPQYFEGKEREEMLLNMRRMMRECCVEDMKFESILRGIKKVNPERTKRNSEAEGNDEENISVNNMYSNMETEANSQAINPEFHQMFIRFEKTIEESISLANKRNDILITDAGANVICPISKQRFIEPLRNKNCSHTYSKESIKTLLYKKKSIRCPVVGCSVSTPFTLNELEPDEAMEQLLRRNNSE